MARTKTPANVVGPQVRKLRNKLDLTQEDLAARCQLHGLDISRGTLSQIEARLRRVADSELFRLSVVLKVSTDDLFPSEMRKERDKLRTKQVSGG
jgi:transcriptional regulator with XRE-family HTH domain